MGIIFYLGIIIDSLYISIASNSFNNEVILAQILIFVLIILLEYILSILYQLFSARFNSKTSKNIRTSVFKALQEKSHKYYDEENTGDIVAKSTSDLVNINNFFYVLSAQGGLMIGLFVFILGPLFYIDFVLGFIALSSLPILISSLIFFEKKYNPIELSSREKYGKVSARVAESIDNSILTKIFNSETHNMSKLKLLMDDLKLTNILKNKKQAILSIQDKIILSVIYSLILFTGGIKVINNQITIGELVTSLLMIQYLIYPIMFLIQIVVFRASYKAAEKRLANILEHPPHVLNPGNGNKFNHTMRGEIKFADVSFGYNNKLVIKNINIQIEANSTVALLGASGSGKSALINLIPRFYDVDSGSIFIDEVDITELDLPSLRRKIGFIDQETFLFSKSIKENIAFGNPEAGMEKIIEVAKISQIHQFIEELPEKYDTVIGERGVTLSGGQRQRLSIARALLLDPKIIIFDDSLSAVDIKTEHKIQSVLEVLLKDRTVIFITQRLSTVLNTDKIIILAKGEIVEIGRHETLIKTNGIYRDLFETQIDGLMDLSRIELGRKGI